MNLNVIECECILEINYSASLEKKTEMKIELDFVYFDELI